MYSNDTVNRTQVFIPWGFDILYHLYKKILFNQVLVLQPTNGHDVQFKNTGLEADIRHYYLLQSHWVWGSVLTILLTT